MKGRNRRDFLSASAWMLSAAGLSSIARAQAIPAFHRSGTLMDVGHVVILMQENRSFDHYFGTLSGVRGFSDPKLAPLGPGRTVWHQQDAQGNILTPFRFDVEGTDFPVMHSLPHDYDSGHKAWNEGRYDRWLTAKGPLTMGHLRREDIPFHYALADAFTICDAYFCSLHGPTDPNRLFMHTGCNDPHGRAGGPVIDNNNIVELPGGLIYGPQWVTYAERLQSAGVSWRAYFQGSDHNSDDDSDGGMNMLLAFSAFRDAKPGDPLYERGVVPRRLEQLKADVMADRLAQVSWIFPPRLFCEHPRWPPSYGAAYMARILDALTSNPAVWAKTVFLVMYDENDGFFDHVVPPAAPANRGQGLSTVDTAGEINPRDGTPYGLGPRVPMLVVSPWSRGGFVCSEVFDHTSILRFLEARFGVREDNITPWRRAVCGDLQSAFDFSAPNQDIPVALQRIDASKRLTTNAEFGEYRAQCLAKPKARAAIGQPLPKVEPGRRRARALGYALAVEERLGGGKIELRFVNHGRLGAVFQVYDQNDGRTAPRRYTLSAATEVKDQWPLRKGAYDLLVHGPNGFVRRFQGHERAPLEVALILEPQAAAEIRNQRDTDQRISVQDRLSGKKSAHIVTAKAPVRVAFDLPAHGDWYDIEIAGRGFLRRFSGKRETGLPGWSDPSLT